MSLNYDPKINRMREFRFRGVDYNQLRLERPEDILTPEEYGSLVLEMHWRFKAEKFVLGSSIVGQFFLGRTSLFRQFNGYIRASVLIGLAVGPWLTMRYFDAKFLNGMYDEMLLKRLDDAYLAPISHKFKPNIS